ncbi:antitoxin Xre/MbcA/ParS toxin-binding domain-containing protein [Sphingobacterium multivorum]|uniref:antitoxin Xre/MbcA/ParS toxin-binding domain-containing protein n=1 Tax=Sphingobacterium multivorum TaxID=28454 RepID=UPI0028A0C8AE|nr:antitoxin Xre/MbcA/ParS toxin-binding domain-containing protein [Sphingobacterium multivorum]
MTTLSLNSKQKKIIKEIPPVGDSSGIYFYTVKSNFDSEFILILDNIIGLNDITLSKWLNITPRTFRNYKNNNELILKDNIKDHIILILSLYKHGIEVFGHVENFEAWLSEKNYLLDNCTPASFLETISGIKFIDNRLTAMEFGENV